MHVYTLPEQTCRAAVPRGLVGNVLGCGATSQFAFSVKALFLWVHGFESLSRHILTKFCILGYQGIPQPSRATDGQRLVHPVPQWTEKLDRLGQHRDIQHVGTQQPNHLNFCDSVSSRAWGISSSCLTELTEQCSEDPDSVRELELIQNRYRVHSLLCDSDEARGR